MIGRTTRLALIAAAGLLLSSCGAGNDGNKASTPEQDANFMADETLWQMQRRESLTRPDGWTSLIGLHWIELKAHYIGSAPENGIRLAIGPPKLGLLQQDDGHITLTPEPGVELTLNGEPVKGRVELSDDQGETPSVIGYDEGKGAITLITRGGRHALRVKHADAESRTGFAGLDYWKPDAAWKVEGRFVPNQKGKTIPVVDIIGTTNQIPNPGAVEFDRAGTTYRIEAMDEGEGSLFLVFADRTNGHGSYGAGRFLDAPMPDKAGKVVLDFNRAYNPPCAFTPFATCPLPPPENRLDLAIEAGEKQYAKPAHSP